MVLKSHMMVEKVNLFKFNKTFNLFYGNKFSKKLIGQRMFDILGNN